MQTSESVDWSTGFDSFLSPNKSGKPESSAQTMSTFSSAQFTDKTMSLPIDTPSRHYHQRTSETKDSSMLRLQKIQQIHPNINQIETMQRWVMMYFQDSKLGAERILLNEKLIKQQKKLNQHKIMSIKSLKNQIKLKKEDYQKRKRSIALRQKRSLLTIKSQIRDRKDSIERIIGDINKLEPKTSRRSRNLSSHIIPGQTPIYVIVGGPLANYSHLGNDTNPQTPHHKSFTQNFHSFKKQSSIIRNSLNPNAPSHRNSKKIYKNQTDQLFQKESDPKSLENPLIAMLKQKLIQNQELPGFTNSQKKPKNSGFRKSSRLSGKWENDGEQKDVLEELTKSQKNNKSKQIKHNQYKVNNINAFLEEPVVTIKKDQKQITPRVSHNLRQSTILIDMPDDSHSKSHEISVEEPKTKIKDKNNQKESVRRINNQNNMKNSNNELKLIQDSYSKSPSSARLAHSEQISSSLLFKDHDQQQDNYDIESIQLLTVSKISKEKEYSLKSTIEKDNQGMGSLQLKKSKRENDKNNPSSNKIMSSIQEESFDEENIKQREYKQRRRKMSGTRYSCIDNIDRNSSNIE